MQQLKSEIQSGDLKDPGWASPEKGILSHPVSLVHTELANTRVGHSRNTQTWFRSLEASECTGKSNRKAVGVGDPSVYVLLLLVNE